MLASRCTYRDPSGSVCGRPAEDVLVHSRPDERKRIGTHIWRHQQTTRRPTTRSADYRRGYDAGLHRRRYGAVQATEVEPEDERDWGPEARAEFQRLTAEEEEK